MSDLQTKLDGILQDKNTNLLPENLKAGITALGVTGTFEGSSTEINNQNKTITANGTYNADDGYDGLGTVIVNVPADSQSTITGVKQFSTVEQMALDTTSSTGDVAIVYDKSYKPVIANTEFTSLMFNDTVVLDEYVGDDTLYTYASQVDDGSGTYFGLNFELNAWSMNCTWQTQEDPDDYNTVVEHSIYYSSLDGVTYNKDAGYYEEPNPLTFEKPLCFYDIDPKFTKFMNIIVPTFEGLYEYGEGSITDYFLVTQLQNIDNTDNRVQRYCRIPYYNNIKDDYGVCTILIKSMEEEVNVNIPSTKLYVATDYDIYFYSNTSLYRNKIDLTNNTISFTTSSSNGDYTIYTIQGGQLINTTFVARAEMSSINPVSYDTSWFIQPVFNYELTDDSMLYYKDTDNNTVKLIMSHIQQTILYTGYKPAATQITLTNANQIMPNIIGLGKNGIITGDGSVYNNLDLDNIVITDLPEKNIVNTIIGNSPVMIYGHTIDNINKYSLVDIEEQITVYSGTNTYAHVDNLKQKFTEEFPTIASNVASLYSSSFKLYTVDTNIVSVVYTLNSNKYVVCINTRTNETIKSYVGTTTNCNLWPGVNYCYGYSTSGLNVTITMTNVDTLETKTLTGTYSGTGVSSAPSLPSATQVLQITDDILCITSRTGSQIFVTIIDFSADIFDIAEIGDDSGGGISTSYNIKIYANSNEILIVGHKNESGSSSTGWAQTYIAGIYNISTHTLNKISFTTEPVTNFEGMNYKTNDYRLHRFADTVGLTFYSILECLDKTYKLIHIKVENGIPVYDYVSIPVEVTSIITDDIAYILHGEQYIAFNAIYNGVYGKVIMNNIGVIMNFIPQGTSAIPVYTTTQYYVWFVDDNDIIHIPCTGSSNYSDGYIGFASSYGIVQAINNAGVKVIANSIKLN